MIEENLTCSKKLVLLISVCGTLWIGGCNNDDNKKRPFTLSGTASREPTKPSMTLVSVPQNCEVIRGSVYEYELEIETADPASLPQIVQLRSSNDSKKWTQKSFYPCYCANNKYRLRYRSLAAKLPSRNKVIIRASYLIADKTARGNSGLRRVDFDFPAPDLVIK